MSSPIRHEPEVGLPDGSVALSASIGLDLTLVLLLTIQEIPVGASVIGASLGILARVDPVTGVDVDGAVELLAGWALPGLDGLPDIPDDLIRPHAVERFDLVTTGGPLVAGAVPTRWSRLFDIGAGDGAAAVLPADTGMIVVEDRSHPWLAALGAGVPLWQSTAADEWFSRGMAYALDGDLVVAGIVGSSIRIDRFSRPASRGGPAG